MEMESIPYVKRAQLVAQMAVKMDTALDEEVRMLKAKGVDVPEMIRSFLRREIPKVKKKLSQPA